MYSVSTSSERWTPASSDGVEDITSLSSQELIWIDVTTKHEKVSLQHWDYCSSSSAEPETERLNSTTLWSVGGLLLTRTSNLCVPKWFEQSKLKRWWVLTKIHYLMSFSHFASLMNSTISPRLSFKFSVTATLHRPTVCTTTNTVFLVRLQWT